MQTLSVSCSTQLWFYMTVSHFAVRTSNLFLLFFCLLSQIVEFFLGDRVILKRMFISVWCLQLFRLLRENVLALQAIKWSFVSISSRDILTQTTIRPSARSSIYPSIHSKSSRTFTSTVLVRIEFI